MTDLDLSVQINGLRFKHPIFVEAAGYVVNEVGMKRMIKAGYSAVFTKSTTARGFKGGPRPRCWLFVPDSTDTSFEGSESLLNPGYKHTAEYIKACKPLAEEHDCHMVASLSPRNFEEGQEMARELEKAGASVIHMDICCPTAGSFRNKQHPNEDWDHLGSYWSTEAERVAEVVKAIKEAVDIPVWPKPLLHRWIISPETITMIDSVGGADAYCFTAPTPAMLDIDPFSGKPLKTYGMMSERLRYTLRLTANLARIVKKPLIPSGGFNTGMDCAKGLMLGAYAVGLCSAIYRDVHVLDQILKDIENFMVFQQKYSIKELQGDALRFLPPTVDPDRENYYNQWVGKYIPAADGDYEW